VETEFGAIEISVWDKDKELASEIANHIALTIDNHNKTMITRDKNVVIETFTNEIKYKEAFIDSLSSAIQAAKERGEKADKIVLMQSRLDSSAEDLNKSRRLLEQYATSASQNFSTIHITEAAYPAIRKDKPVRSLIVIGATLGAFLFMLILAIVVENYRKIKDSL
jgi:capsular polysaccharide biosynthesis protein